jgi:hypothetical protein
MPLVLGWDGAGRNGMTWKGVCLLPPVPIQQHALVRCLSDRLLFRVTVKTIQADHTGNTMPQGCSTASSRTIRNSCQGPAL